MTKTFTLAAAAAAVLVSAPVFASDRVERVAYGDLNLASANGQAELQHRLDKAAHKACMFDAKGQLSTTDQAADCYHDARKTADVRFAEAVARTGKRNG